MRRFFALILMVVLAAAAWFGARWFAHRGEVKATIVFDDASSLRRGDPVLEDAVVVGRVIRIDKVDDRDAVTVRLSRDHRRAIVTDSLFSAERHALDVSNTFAVGRPIDDGAILYAREDKISRWLVRHGGAVKPLLDKARAKADALIDDDDFAGWTAKVPEWKKEGGQSLQRNLDDARRSVDKAVTDLRASNHAEEAKKLKERFEKWIDDVTR
jgi:hypothetical protein